MVRSHLSAINIQDVLRLGTEWKGEGLKVDVLQHVCCATVGDNALMRRFKWHTASKEKQKTCSGENSSPGARRKIEEDKNTIKFLPVEC